MKSHTTAKRFLQEFVSARQERLQVFASKWAINASQSELEQRQRELKRFWEAEWDYALGDNEQGRNERLSQLNRWVSASRNALVLNSKTGAVELNVQCLTIMLASHCSAVMDKMTHCDNDECERLFLKVREDQKYCSQECAKPAKREAKLRWWHKNNQK